MACSEDNTQRITVYIADSTVPSREVECIEEIVSLTTQNRLKSIESGLHWGKYSISLLEGTDHENYMVKRMLLANRRIYPSLKRPSEANIADSVEKSDADGRNENNNNTPTVLNCDYCSLEAETVWKGLKRTLTHQTSDTNDAVLIRPATENVAATGDPLLKKPKKEEVEQESVRETTPILEDEAFVETANVQSIAEDTVNDESPVDIPVKDDEGDEIHLSGSCKNENINASSESGQKLSDPSAECAEDGGDMKRSEEEMCPDVARKGIENSNWCPNCPETFASDAELSEHIHNLHKELPNNEFSGLPLPATKPCPRRYKTNSSASADATAVNVEYNSEIITTGDPDEGGFVRQKLPETQKPVESGNEQDNNNNNIGLTEKKAAISGEGRTRTAPEQLSGFLNSTLANYFRVTRAYRCSHCTNKYVQEKHLKRHLSLHHETECKDEPVG